MQKRGEAMQMISLEQELKLNKSEYTRYVSGLSGCKKRLIKYRNVKELYGIEP